MTRMPFDSPLLLGFEQTRDLLERLGRAGEGYPPYNIEQLEEGVRLTFAVAGFGAQDLEVVVEHDQLTISGRREGEAGEDRAFLHRGIATRAFNRSFALTGGIKVTGASLIHGLLHVDLERPVHVREAVRIPIRTTV